MRSPLNSTLTSSLLVQ